MSYGELEPHLDPRPADPDEGATGTGDGSVALDKLRRHPGIAVGLLPLVVLAVKLAPYLNSNENTTLDSSTTITRSISMDLNGDNRIEPAERITQADLDQLPDPASLPPVLPTPIEGEKGVPKELEGHEPYFVGAYRAIEGEAFNFYIATQPGEEAAADHTFQVNPQPIEYILRQIRSHIHDAPENPAKQSIIDNLRAIRDGDKESITDIFVDVSPTGGCLDAAGQLVKFAEAVCSNKAGAANAVTKQLSNDEELVILSAGSSITGQHPRLAGKVPRQIVRNVPGQQRSMDHEMIHVLSGVKGNSDAYKEGDADHEITSWLIDGYHYHQYDFAGATGPSPQLGKKLQLLVAADKLPPLLSVQK